MAIKMECLLSPPPPSPLAPIKIQNGDIMVPTNPVPPGKWAFRMDREGEGQRKMTGLLCITSCHTITLFMIITNPVLTKCKAFLFHPTYLVTAKHCFCFPVFIFKPFTSTLHIHFTIFLLTQILLTLCHQRSSCLHTAAPKASLIVLQ